MSPPSPLIFPSCLFPYLPLSLTVFCNWLYETHKWPWRRLHWPTVQLASPSTRPSPSPPVLAGGGCWMPGLLVPATVVHWGKPVAKCATRFISACQRARKREREKRRKRNRRGHFLIYKQNVCRVAQVFMKHFKPADTAAPTLFPAKLTLQLFGAWEQMAAAAAAVSSRSNCGGM